jgi:ketosteroid isomerase-like protein
MKRILKIGIYRPGDLAHEVTGLADVNANVSGNRMVFSGHATVDSRFKDQDFSSLYRLSKVYEKQQGRWRVVASKTARLGDK